MLLIHRSDNRLSFFPYGKNLSKISLSICVYPEFGRRWCSGNYWIVSRFYSWLRITRSIGWCRVHKPGHWAGCLCIKEKFILLTSLKKIFYTEQVKRNNQKANCKVNWLSDHCSRGTALNREFCTSVHVKLPTASTSLSYSLQMPYTFTIRIVVWIYCRYQCFALKAVTLTIINRHKWPR